MVEVKSKADNGKGGCVTSISIEGYGREILEEALAAVQCIMSGLRDQSVELHMLALQAIAENPVILLGDNAEEKEYKRDDIRHIKFREGVN